MVAADAADTVALWFDRHAASVAAYAARGVGPVVAVDVVAETYRVALEPFGSFEDFRESERPWLMGIATNVLRRHWRSEQRRLRAHARSAVAEVCQIHPLPAVDESVGASNEYRRVIDAVAQLPVDDYELLVLIAWEQMSSRDAAEVLGIPAGTLRSRLRRIRMHLAQGAVRG
jgi:RNA polymerase sigma factor (sigma-70 family)